MKSYSADVKELFGDVEPRHILSLSGGKDSAALAIYLRDRVPTIEYIFHDTDKELPETYDYIARLEAILGKPIVRTTPVDSFDHWLAVYRGMLPSNHRRWCTRMLKLKPFETYVGDGPPVINYVGLRADENRTGYISTKSNILAVYPFQDDGLVRADIINILEDSGLGLPPYMDWGGDLGRAAIFASISRRSSGSGSTKPTLTSSNWPWNMKRSPWNSESNSIGARTKRCGNCENRRASRRSKPIGKRRRREKRPNEAIVH